MKKKSIAISIAIKIGILAVAISAVLGGIAIVQSQSTIRQQVNEELSKLTISGAEKVSNVVSLKIQILQEIANRSRVQSMDFDTQKEAITADIEEKGYLDMAIVSLDGQARYILDDTTADLSDREYVKKALAGEGNISDVIISKVTGEAVLMYAVPIWNADKTQVQGALIARRDGNALYTIIDGMGYGKKGYAYVINASGVVVAHPNEELVKTQFAPIVAAETDSQYTSLASVFQNMLDTKEGVGEYTYKGNELFNSYAEIEGTPWILVCTAFKSEALLRLNQLVAMLLVSMGILVVVSLVIAYAIGKQIAAPIVRLTKVMNKRAELDFTADDNSIKSVGKKRQNEIDSMCSSAEIMSENVRQFVLGVADTAEQVSATSQELSATSQQSASVSEEVAQSVNKIAMGADDQAQTTEKASQSIENLNVEIESNVEGASELSSATEKINESVLKGNSTVEDLFDKNKKNGVATTLVYESVLKTRESTEKISDATSMILSIASQTNLLALNASIEAARAGEQGRGFAVVAEEIRVLAEQSRKMTSSIEEIVKGLIEDAELTVSKMNETNSIVKEQEEIVSKTKDAFVEIAREIKNSEIYVSKILDSANRMQGNKDEVLSNLDALSQVALDNAAATQQVSAAVEEHSAAAEEISRASEELSDMALNLQTMISKFKF